MPNSKEKLNRFTAAVLRQAAEESERAQAEFEARRQQLLAESRAQARVEANAYRHSEIARMRAEAGQQVSRRMQESKETLFRRRSALSAEVFDEVRRKIAAYTETPEYAARLEALLQAALERLAEADQVTIYLRKCDLRYQTFLGEGHPEVRMAFRESSFQLGGLIVEAPCLGLRMDASFDSRLRELSGHFAELFGLSLADVEEEAAQ